MHVVKIKVKQSTAFSRVEESNHLTIEKSQCGPNETDRGANSFDFRNDLSFKCTSMWLR